MFSEASVSHYVHRGGDRDPFPQMEIPFSPPWMETPQDGDPFPHGDPVPPDGPPKRRSSLLLTS